MMTDVLEPTDLSLSGFRSVSSLLYRNLESFPGQIMTSPPELSARSEGRLARADAVRMTQQAVRTSEHLRGGIEKSSNLVVGAGLRVQPTPDWDLLGIEDKEVRQTLLRRLKTLFHNWAYDSRLLQDAEGHYTFGGMVWQSWMDLKGPAAETALIVQYDATRARDYSTPWGTFVQVIDPARISTPPSQVGNNQVYEGRRLDKWNRMIGLYVRRTHPTDYDGAPEEWAYVPREGKRGRPMAIHYFEKTRGNQQRGMTKLITVLRQSTMLDQFDDAHLARAVISSVLATYIKSASDPETVAEQLAPARTSTSGFEAKLDYYKKARLRLGTHALPVLPEGDDIMMKAIEGTFADPSAFRAGPLNQFGMALGLSSEQISNDFSGSNYSNIRAAMIEVMRGVFADRDKFFPAVPGAIYAAVIEEAFAKGWISVPAGVPSFYEARAAWTSCRFNGPPMGEVDPLKGAQAQDIRFRNKSLTRQQAAAEGGRDHLDDFEQIGQEIVDAESRGFSLDPPMPGQSDDPTQTPVGGKTDDGDDTDEKDEK